MILLLMSMELFLLIHIPSENYYLFTDDKNFESIPFHLFDKCKY